MQREKGSDLTNSCDKSSHTNRKESQETTQRRQQKIVYTTIADRLRTVSWSKNCHSGHPTGVVKPVNGIPTFPLTAKDV